MSCCIHEQLCESVVNIISCPRKAPSTNGVRCRLSPELESRKCREFASNKLYHLWWAVVWNNIHRKPTQTHSERLRLLPSLVWRQRIDGRSRCHGANLTKASIFRECKRLISFRRCQSATFCARGWEYHRHPSKTARRIRFRGCDWHPVGYLGSSSNLPATDGHLISAWLGTQ